MNLSLKNLKNRRIKTRPGVRLIAACLASLAFTFAVPGCLVTSSEHETHTGNYVPQETFDHIKVGETTTAWVRSTLGEPSSVTGPSDDEVWKYVYTTRTDSHGAVFLIFGGSSVSKTTNEAFFEFRDGVVYRKWRTGEKS